MLFRQQNLLQRADFLAEYSLRASPEVLIFVRTFVASERRSFKSRRIYIQNKRWQNEHKEQKRFV